jgi:hypothetical protein
MITFLITTEQRRRAQDRAAELDVSRSDPPGRHPYVWDNRQNCVTRWYDYESREDKLGTVYFEAVVADDGSLSDSVRCTTELTFHPIGPERPLRQVSIIDPAEHGQLVELFFTELLGIPPKSASVSPNTRPPLGSSATGQDLA